MKPRRFSPRRVTGLRWAALAVTALVLTALAILGLRPIPPPATPFAGGDWLPARPLLVAAGGSPTAPPYTLPAFRRALADGFTALELPLRFTADGEPVVCREGDLARITNGEGPVERLTIGELQALDAGFRFRGAAGDYPFRGHGLQVPLLEEVLAAFPGVLLFLDLTGPPPAPAHLGRLAEIIRRWEVSALIIVAAKTPEAAAALRRQFPGRPAVATPGESGSFLRLARLGLAWYARPAFRVVRTGAALLTERELQGARNRGLAILAGPISSRSEAALLSAGGVDLLLLSGPAAAPPLPPARPAK